jgi:integrase
LTEKPQDRKHDVKGGAGRTLAPKALTSRFLESVEAGVEPFRIRDTKTLGLSVRVSVDGKVTFYVSARISGGKVFSRPIGRFGDDLTLQEARDRAAEITKAARAGRDLMEDEAEATRTAAAALTVEQLLEKYLKGRVRGKLRTAPAIERTLKRALQSIIHMKAGAVRRAHVRELLDDVAESGREREAEKRRQTIGAMFRWAVAKDLVEVDPTAGLPVYDAGTPRDRVLSVEEIRSFLSWLDSDIVPLAHGSVLRLQLLLGARVGEIAGMTAEEIDMDSWVWTLPAERSKNGKPRATPIIGWARQIIHETLDGGSGALFLSEQNSTLTSSTVGQWLRSNRHKLGIEHFVSHDLRRTVATHLDEMGVSRDMIGALIGHESDDRKTAVLRRHYLKGDAIERKKAVLLSWDARIREICGEGLDGGNVVAFSPTG